MREIFFGEHLLANHFIRKRNYKKRRFHDNLNYPGHNLINVPKKQIKES